VKGHKACLICEEDTFSVQLKYGRRTIYLGTLRFLPTLHRYQKLRKAFNGSIGEEKVPKALNGKQVYENMKHLCQVVKKISKIKFKRMCRRSD